VFPIVYEQFVRALLSGFHGGNVCGVTRDETERVLTTGLRTEVDIPAKAVVDL
jgi:hypothetical protein